MHWSGGCPLYTLLAVLWLSLLSEVYLEVGRVIVVPVLLTIDTVLDAEEHGLCLKVRLVGDLDVEVESVKAVRVLGLSNVVVELCNNF